MISHKSMMGIIATEAVENWTPKKTVYVSNADFAEALDTLRLLHDYQNGCPLPKYEKYWTKAMEDAERILAKFGK